MVDNKDSQIRPMSNQALGMERGKQRRRDAIFSAAEKLIRSHRSTDFSMNELARSAAVSTYTIYNLIGAKDVVFYTLLNRAIDQIELVRVDRFSQGDALSILFGAADSVITTFVQDADFYRPLMRHLLGIPDPVNRPLFMARAFDYWLSATQPAADSGIFRADVSAPALARSIQVFFTGITDCWIHDEVSDAEFGEHVRYGVAAFLLASVKQANLFRLTEVMGDTANAIEAAVARSG